MKTSRYLLVICVVLLIVSLPLLAACGGDGEKTVSPTSTQTEQPTPTTEKPVVVKIGFIGDFTGPYAAYSPLTSDGLDDYVWYVNNKIGGLADGRVKIEYLWRDTGNDVTKSIKAYEELKGAGVDILYIYTTTILQALAARINEDHIPTISQGPAAAALTPPGSIYLRYPFYPDMFGMFFDWFLENWNKPEPPKFAILTTDFPLGHEMLTDEIKSYIASKGVKLVATELVPVAPVDVAPQLSRIRDAGADFCFGNNLAQTSAAILRGMEQMGLKDQLVYGASTVGIGEDMLKLLAQTPEVADGFLYTRAFAAFEETNNPTIKLINQVYQERHGKTPPYSECYLFGWCVMSTMVEAVRLALDEVAPEQLSPAAIEAYGFKRMKNYSPGVFGGNGQGEGLMNYAEFGNAGSAYLRIARTMNGKIEIISDWRKAPNITGIPGY